MLDFLGEGARFIHVIFGVTGLAAYWIPVFAKKGAVNHVRFGKIFVWSAYIVLGGATISLIARFSNIFGESSGEDPNPAFVAFLVFLSYLVFITYVSVQHGMDVLQHKRDPAALRRPFNQFIAYASIAASISLILYAVIQSPPNIVLLLALSPIGFAIGSGNLRYMNSTSTSPRAWLYEHLGAMIGSGIAFHTAFAVFGAGQLFDIGFTGWVAVIPWVAPSIIGIPASFLWVRHYRRKFGEIGATT